MSAVRLGVVVWSLFSRAAAGGKFVAWPCLRFKKPIFESMTGRIVLSHVHVFTLRRTRSTEKLISTGLASGGIITLE